MGALQKSRYVEVDPYSQEDSRPFRPTALIERCKAFLYAELEKGSYARPLVLQQRRRELARYDALF